MHFSADAVGILSSSRYHDTLLTDSWDGYQVGAAWLHVAEAAERWRAQLCALPPRAHMPGVALHAAFLPACHSSSVARF